MCVYVCVCVCVCVTVTVTVCVTVWNEARGILHALSQMMRQLDFAELALGVGICLLACVYVCCTMPLMNPLIK